MSEVKHTPGPWVISELNGAIDGEEDILIEHEGCPIATVRGSDDMSCVDIEDLPTINAEVIATAKLIAAAPILLEALIFCRSVIKSNGIYDVSDRMAFDKANEAIKSATE